MSDENGTILWYNRTRQSIRRPLKLEYIKETKETITKENNDIKAEVDKLEVFKIKIDDEKTIEINYRLYLTAIDRKVLNVLKGTKATQC